MAGYGTEIDWGGIVNLGFNLLQGAIGKKTTGPLASTTGTAPPPTAAMPSWVVPVAIIVGLFLMFKKKLF